MSDESTLWSDTIFSLSSPIGERIKEPALSDSRMGEASMNQSQLGATRRIVFVAGPGVEILDLVGPLQVFARASEMHTRENPGFSPIYSVEVVTISSRRSLIANCGLQSAIR